MLQSNKPTNANQRKDVKQFISCRKCGSTLLEERTYKRTTLDEWSEQKVEFHSITVNKCGGCGELVLLKLPKSALEKSLIDELLGKKKPEDHLFKQQELDVNQFAERKRRFIQRAGVGAQQKGLPPIDPNKPLVNTDGERQ